MTTATAASPEAQALLAAMVDAGQVNLDDLKAAVDAPPAFAEPTTSPDQDMRALATEAVRWHSDNRPRSLQVALGPSSVGEPCTRKLAYRMLDWPKANPDTDPWPSFVGTAVHAAMEDVFSHPRWEGRFLIEQRVTVRAPGLSGSVDLYDTLTETSIDYKILGETSLKKYKKDGPSQTYEIQGDLYGLGVKNTLGRSPKRVAIWMFPRGGMLSGLHVWSKPWDEDKALRALTRMDTVIASLEALDIENKPEHWSALPTAESACTWCSYFKPQSTDLSVGCPGHKA